MRGGRGNMIPMNDLAGRKVTPNREGGRIGFQPFQVLTESNLLREGRDVQHSAPQNTHHWTPRLT